MTDYFGKGCTFLGARREGDCDEGISQEDLIEEEPIISHCSHTKNPKDEEGNCNPENCPIVVTKKEAQEAKNAEVAEVVEEKKEILEKICEVLGLDYDPETLSLLLCEERKGL